MAHGPFGSQSVAAASGYVFLKANSKPSSYTELGLDGIKRDEVYHYAVMLAGVKDDYFGCCTIERARALAAAAVLPQVRASLRLVEYPEADHAFVLPDWTLAYRPADEADAFRRAVEHLRAAQTPR